jgi:hypothetical protein
MKLPSVPTIPAGTTARRSAKENGMPLPLIAGLVGAALGRATKKEQKKQAVSKYKKKSGTKVKAYTRKVR